VNAIEDTVEMQQRRALLKRVAWMLGGAVSAPTALAILQGCSAKETPAGVAWTPRFLDATQATLISALADVIIPTTDTRGALDAGVPAFIDSIMADVYPKDAQERFKAGIEEFGEAAKASGKSFLEQDAVQRTTTVRRAIEMALETSQDPKPFILVARELTLLGFYSSKVGITENMEYVSVPTAYHGCVPLADMKKHVYWE
jgi:gluconate 2-dehydrogenase gamma chain